MADSYNWQHSQRQPVRAMFYLFYTTFIKLLKVFWPVILLRIFRTDKKKPEDSSAVYWLYISLFVTLLTLAGALLDYFYFRFYINTEGQLIINKGFWTKRKTTIPLKNIQGIHIQQKWLQRILQLSEVTIDSPGTEKAETKIILLPAQASALKNFMLKYTAEDAAAADNEQEKETTVPEKNTPYQIIFNLAPADLLKLGLSANHFETLLLIAGFLFSVMQNIRDASADYYTQSKGWLLQHFSPDTIKGLLLLTLLIVLVSVFISFIRILLQYGNFMVAKNSKGFKVNSGLINTREKTIPHKKVQYLKYSANWIGVRMHLYLLQFFSIGGAEIQNSLKVKIPLTRLNLLPVFISDYCAQPPEGEGLYIDKKYLAFYGTLLLFALTVIVIVNMYFNNLNVLWLVPIAVYFLFYLYLRQKKFLLQFNTEVLYINNSSFGHSITIIQWNKLQKVILTQTRYQKKHQLASVVLGTAANNITIPYIPLTDAQKLVNYALYRVENRE